VLVQVQSFMPIILSIDESMGGWVGGRIGELIDRYITTKDIDMEALFVQAPQRMTRQFCPHH
jgi:hypothetical protein